jgi:hypothetical protein
MSGSGCTGEARPRSSAAASNTVGAPTIQKIPRGLSRCTWRRRRLQPRSGEPRSRVSEAGEAIRNKILRAFELAEAEEDPRAHRDLLTFVIVGAGPAGVEIAADQQLATGCRVSHRASKSPK